MNKKITILPGDGIGPEVTAQSIKVLNAIGEQYGHQFSYEYHLIGADAIDKTGNPLPDETIDSCLQSDAVLLGAVGHPKFDNDPSAKVRPEQGLLKIRKSLGLFANIRPVSVHKALAHLVPLKESYLEGVDMVIYRELTGGIYFGNKTTDGNIATDDCSYSREEITRIADLAFKQAMIRRKKLTLVDKANVLETSRLWRKVVQEMSAGYPEVAVDYMFVDNAAMQLIINPRQFDVMLTENMFGDILSDEASVLSGSLGLLPSASVGKKTALFEPIHGSYPQAAGKDIANPLGSILSIGMLMDHFGLHDEANVIRKAVDQSLATGIVTKDINATEHYGTEAIGSAIASYILGNEASFTETANKEIGQSTVI